MLTHVGPHPLIMCPLCISQQRIAALRDAVGRIATAQVRWQREANATANAAEGTPSGADLLDLMAQAAKVAGAVVLDLIAEEEKRP